MKEWATSCFRESLKSVKDTEDVFYESVYLRTRLEHTGKSVPITES